VGRAKDEAEHDRATNHDQGKIDPDFTLTLTKHYAQTIQTECTVVTLLDWKVTLPQTYERDCLDINGLRVLTRKRETEPCTVGLRSKLVDSLTPFNAQTDHT
jgi:hypothetical protein